MSKASLKGALRVPTDLAFPWGFARYGRFKPVREKLEDISNCTYVYVISISLMLEYVKVLLSVIVERGQTFAMVGLKEHSAVFGSS